MTWLEEGAPSTLTPGRRPRTTLTPTLVLKDGQAVAALGSPGGDQQDQWQLLYLLRCVTRERAYWRRPPTRGSGRAARQDGNRRD